MKKKLDPDGTVESGWIILTKVKKRTTADFLDTTAGRRDDDGRGNGGGVRGHRMSLAARI